MYVILLIDTATPNDIAIIVWIGTGQSYDGDGYKDMKMNLYLGRMEMGLDLGQ